jgi:hypothetical protein
MKPQGWAKVKQGARYADIIEAHLEKFTVTGKEVDSVVDKVPSSFQMDVGS